MYLTLRTAVVVLLTTASLAGTPGSFRGILYAGADTKPGWWYVAGRHDSLRLVYLGNATVTYDEKVPGADRLSVPAQSLASGADVRVTAEQDEKGMWRATEVEILSVKGTKRATSKPHQPRHHAPVQAPAQGSS
jgi:hypothetical protein